ncbi:hypothetical protein CPAV1605_1030 [seawater metagenome]|uniref:Uncharacterized protein n=1 Tax=seawater metagenome TaxID=1561972 RepID=A0A5E8CM21_9ZZZZ
MNINFNIEYQRLADFKKFNKKINDKLINLGGNISEITELNKDLFKDIERIPSTNYNGPVFNFNPSKDLFNKKKYNFSLKDLSQADIYTPTSSIDLIPISKKEITSNQRTKNQSKINLNLKNKILKKKSTMANPSLLTPNLGKPIKVNTNYSSTIPQNIKIKKTGPINNLDEQTSSGQTYVSYRPDITINYEQPQVSSMQQPQVSSMQQPSVSSMQQPSVSSMQQPSVSSMQQPSVSSMQQPQVSSMQQPSVSSDQTYTYYNPDVIPIDPGSPSGIKPSIPIDASSSSGIKPSIPIDASSSSGIKPSIPIDASSSSEIKPSITIDASSSSEIKPLSGPDGTPIDSYTSSEIKPIISPDESPITVASGDTYNKIQRSDEILRENNKGPVTKKVSYPIIYQDSGLLLKDLERLKEQNKIKDKAIKILIEKGTENVESLVNILNK